MPSTCFLYHSLVGFVNAPDYDREDCVYAEYMFSVSFARWVCQCSRL